MLKSRKRGAMQIGRPFLDDINNHILVGTLETDGGDHPSAQAGNV